MIVRNNKVLKVNNKWLKPESGFDPYNPLGLPPYTIRFRWATDGTPRIGGSYTASLALVDDEQHIWDANYQYSDWRSLFEISSSFTGLVEVLGANSTGVTNMSQMFQLCQALQSVQLFDTSSVTDMQRMFYRCTSLTSVPLFNTSNAQSTASMFAQCESLTIVPLFDTANAIDMRNMFYRCTSLTSVPLFNTSSAIATETMFANCYNVQSGALALYQQASTQTTPPSIHSSMFYHCGSNTQSGAAELAQIPSEWGGTASTGGIGFDIEP